MAMNEPAKKEASSPPSADPQRSLRGKLANAEIAESAAEDAEVWRWDELPFNDWAAATSPLLSWDADHHRELFKKLEAVTSGECERLMVFMPPRHGKSETVTIHY